MHTPSRARPSGRMTSRRRNALGLCILGAVACAPTDDDETIVEQAPPLALAQAGRLVGPDGAYFADVVTNGTGCPEGSAQTQISSDGQVFTTTFSQYEVELNPSSELAMRDCQISIKLRSPAGQSYAVHAFYYSGTTFLEEGVRGQQTANYYFQGAAVTSRSVRTELIGPRDEVFVYKDEIATPQERVWSPCGKDSDLEIITRMRLDNSKPGRSGYMNLSALDGATKLEFKLDWRPCQEPASPAPAAPARAPTAPPARPTPPTPAPTGNQGNPITDGLGGVIGGLGDVLGGLGDTLGGLLGGTLGLLR